MSKIENHYGKWVNSETPITGVAQNNHVEWLYEAIDDGINLALKHFMEDLDEQLENEEIDQDTYDEMLEFFEFSPDDTILIGDWLKDDEGKYYPDKENGDYAAIVGEIYTQVVFSHNVKRCALCSPCYPGQGDLDTPGDFLTYDLPADIYGDSEEG